jgi:hypothetical protein
VFIGTGVTLEVSRQAIGHFVIFSFDICYVKIELGQVVYPPLLSTQQLGLVLEKLQGLVVHNHMKLVAHQLVFPLLEGLEYCQRFEFMYRIVLLGVGEFF